MKKHGSAWKHVQLIGHHRIIYVQMHEATMRRGDMSALDESSIPSYYPFLNAEV